MHAAAKWSRRLPACKQSCAPSPRASAGASARSSPSLRSTRARSGRWARCSCAAVTLPLAVVGYLVARSLLKTEPQAWWRDMSTTTWLKIIFGSGLLAGFAGVFFFYLGLSLPGGDISRLRPIALRLRRRRRCCSGGGFSARR